MAVADYDLYETLGVASDASDADIKAAFARLARITHPDAGGNAALFARVNEAHQILSDRARRAAYDRERTSGPDAGASPGAGGSSEASPGPSSGPGPADASSSGGWSEDRPIWDDWEAAMDEHFRRQREQSEAETARLAAEAAAARAWKGSHDPGYGSVPEWASAGGHTWTVIWRFGLLGMAFCSFVSQVLAKVPHRGAPLGSFSGYTLGFSMLVGALGAVAVALRVRPGLLRGLPVLVWVYGLAAVLALVVVEANVGSVSNAVLLGAVGVVAGTRRPMVRRALLGEDTGRRRRREPGSSVRGLHRPGTV